MDEDVEKVFEATSIACIFCTMLLKAPKYTVEDIKRLFGVKISGAIRLA